MKSVPLKSVTFYQSVRLNGKEFSTVILGDAINRRTQMIYCEDKIFIRSPDWKNSHSADTVSVIGLHNVRHMVIGKDAFLKSEFADVFKVLKVEVSDDDKSVTLSTSGKIVYVPPVEKVLKFPSLGHSQVDDASFLRMSLEDRVILLKIELKRFKIDYDSRHGHVKLLARFNEGREDLAKK